ncbi:MAG: hypothetical protein GF384_04695 [Elusimicrobia bacterium]|nr:hypothetical protein [Elusimicrobiota bacterium]MBD3412128.1 hypothetical protein [Elusimicrobiota bacterium]
MAYNRNLNWYLRQRQARLKDLGKTKPFIAGSLVEIRKRCGNPRCRCTRGEKHRGYAITSKHKGKTRTQYVPVGMYKTVQRWIIEYRVLKGIIKDIDHIQRVLLKRFVKERGRNTLWKNQ